MPMCTDRALLNSCGYQVTTVLWFSLLGGQYFRDPESWALSLLSKFDFSSLVWYGTGMPLCIASLSAQIPLFPLLLLGHVRKLFLGPPLKGFDCFLAASEHFWFLGMFNLALCIARQPIASQVGAVFLFCIGMYVVWTIVLLDGIASDCDGSISYFCP